MGHHNTGFGPQSDSEIILVVVVSNPDYLGGNSLLHLLRSNVYVIYIILMLEWSLLNIFIVLFFDLQ